MIIVTRHKAIVDFAHESGLIPRNEKVTVLDHVADYKLLEGQDVIGVLPNYIACHAKTITEIPIILPKELRGKEMDIEDVRKYARKPRKYIVQQVR